MRHMRNMGDLMRSRQDSVTLFQIWYIFIGVYHFCGKWRNFRPVDTHFAHVFENFIWELWEIWSNYIQMLATLFTFLRIYLPNLVRKSESHNVCSFLDIKYGKFRKHVFTHFCHFCPFLILCSIFERGHTFDANTTHFTFISDTLLTLRTLYSLIYTNSLYVTLNLPHVATLSDIWMHSLLCVPFNVAYSHLPKSSYHIYILSNTFLNLQCADFMHNSIRI